MMAYGLAFREHMEKGERKFRKIFDHSNDGIVIFDAEGNIDNVNLKAQEMWGYSHAEFIALNLADIQSSHTRTPYKGMFPIYSKGPHSHASDIEYTWEIEFQRKDGSEFCGEISGSDIHLDGQLWVLGIVRDITQRKKAELEKERLNKELVQTSRRAGMADVATSVLHNVGNVLNSVNVAAGIVQQAIRRLSVDKVSRTAKLLHEHTENLDSFLRHAPKGQQIPEYLTALGAHLLEEQAHALGEIEALNNNIGHIKEIVSAQQSMAKMGGVFERIRPTEIMEQALTVNFASMQRHGVDIVRDYCDLPEMITDKHQVLQILINLISNAKYAIMENGAPPSRMTLQVNRAEDHEGYVIWRVTDTGKGIPSENMTRMFTQGFTTKKTGHGFGLHSAALSAKLMGGSLTVHSDGVNQGATFTLELPVNPLRPEENHITPDSSLIAQEKSGATSHE